MNTFVARFRTVIYGAAIALCVLSCPAPARAGWPVASGRGVALGFGDTYAAPDGRVCTHRGADVPGEVGAGVLAPAAGTVTFAGRVPGPHGGTVTAVTLEVADGRLLTLMPLAALSVGAGDEIAEGDALGDLAGSGDPSTGDVHVHVSLRTGDVYLDPVALLGASPAVQPATEPAPTSAPRAVTPPAPAAAHAPAAPAAPAQPTAAAQPAAAPVAASPAPGAAALAAPAANARPSAAPAPHAADAAGTVRSLRAAQPPAASPASARSALGALAAAAGVPLACFAAALGVLAMRRREDVSDESSSDIGTAGVEVATARVR